MTFSGSTVVPNKRLATRATSACCSANVPGPAIVADVPTQRRFLAWQRSRTRRTSRATSGALPAPIGVQLVEHQEREPLSGPDHRPVDRAREQVLEHHVVREQDVRRVVADLVALLFGLLARVPAERHWRLALRVAELKNFANSFSCELASAFIGYTTIA